MVDDVVVVVVVDDDGELVDDVSGAADGVITTVDVMTALGRSETDKDKETKKLPSRSTSRFPVVGDQSACTPYNFSSPSFNERKCVSLTRVA